MFGSAFNCFKAYGTNDGTWHGDSTDEVKYRLDNREFKGTRRRFRYQNKQRPDQHGCWILLEYGSESISENIVICKLKISDHGHISSIFHTVNLISINIIFVYRSVYFHSNRI